MKKVLYIHGAFSAFKPDSEKVKGLSKEFEVVGVSYSIEKPFNENMKILEDFCVENEVDFIVGTSLGGLFASELSYRLGKHSILINPCVEPQMSLSKIIGKQQNFATGKEEELTAELVATYPNMAKIERSSMVFLGMKDELIDANKTELLYKDKTQIVKNENEDHYWEFFEENKKITEFISKRVA
ncbi:MAG: hypothetical protein CL760_11640 [Chloroflexi bacterium]|nr:hypothetical protein [Chloroflexota bacterium]|tara:strand:- start:94306 stop:94860 length:555 start_codon:yes stop_codon:yes gene_type:complete